jgi:hypothetical protein
MSNYNRNEIRQQPSQDGILGYDNQPPSKCDFVFRLRCFRPYIHRTPGGVENNALTAHCLISVMNSK